MIPAVMGQTVVRDEANGLDAVIAEDVIDLGAERVALPNRGELASWLITQLQKKSAFATDFAFAGKEGPRYRTTLKSYLNDIYERGYVRLATDEVPFIVAVTRTVNRKNPVTARFVDHKGNPITPDLSPERAEAFLKSAQRLFTSFANRYRAIGLTLEESYFQMGVDKSGHPFVINFPGLPESSIIVDAKGEPYGYRLLVQGKIDLFLQRYREILDKFGVVLPEQQLFSYA